MLERLTADLCVIGGGAGGLSVAAGAAQMGARVVLFESGAMGGDCLNYGCVPSKSLLAAGKARTRWQQDAGFGLQSAPAQVDFEAVKAHVRQVIASIAPMDSVERFEGLGVRVIQASARFVGRRTVEGGGIEVLARRVVVATGSRPSVPPVPGLRDGPYLTNETIFDVAELPDHLLILGGGPIGLELGQAFRNLGSRVTVLEMATILAKDDPELVALLRQRLAADGIDLLETTQLRQVTYPAEGGVRVRIEAPDASGSRDIDGSHLLVAAGRVPAIDGLDLEAGGIRHTRAGITVDRGLRANNRRVYAIGDATGPFPFTHMAGYQAGVVLRSALFRLPATVSYQAVPWVTYCDPELASVGLSEEQARAAHREIRVLRWPFAENDRALAERTTDGLVKIVTAANGRILGAGIVGPHAGELLQIWCLAIARKLKIGAVAGVILPYPTLSEAGKRAAGSFFTPRLFSERVGRITRLLARLG